MTTFRYYAIVPDGAAERVLLVESGGRWTLPYFEPDRWVLWQAVDHVTREMCQRLDLDLTTLRCVGIYTHPELGTGSPLYEMENHGGDTPQTEGTRWVDAAELAGLELDVPEHRGVLTDWHRAERRRAQAATFPPWYRTGWFTEAAGWVSDVLAGRGVAQIAPVEQCRSSQRSAVLRAATAEGLVYLKAVPGMFGYEPSLTLALSERFPDLLPRVVAIDRERSWMLTESCGASDLSAYEDVEVWFSALERYAHLQIELTGETDWLRRLGCPDWGLERLPGAMDRLLTDTVALGLDKPWGLSEAEIERLRARVPEVKSACDALAAYSVPHSLEHGDFGYWQVMVEDGRSRFIDWSDASISHPFFSLWFMLGELQYGAPSMVGHWAALRDAYLRPWTRFEPMNRLVEAFELSRPLASLHQAAIYHDTIMPAAEIGWEWERMVPYCLKRLVRED